MTKYVSETKAARSLSAWVILNKKGEYVAKVQAHFADSGNVLVNIFQTDKAQERCWKARKMDMTKARGDASLHFQAATAGGYGYDKLTAALSGLVIDGHELTNHCSTLGAPKRPSTGVYSKISEPPKGYRYANSVPNDREDWTKGLRGYSDCFREAGLDYLSAVGYRVVSAV